MISLSVTRPEQYELLYESLIGKRDGYTIKQARIIGEVMSKMEAIGRVKETITGGIDLYTPKEVPAIIELENEEFSLAKEIFGEMTWSGKGLKKAIDAADWLNEAEKNGKSIKKES